MRSVIVIVSMVMLGVLLAGCTSAPPGGNVTKTPTTIPTSTLATGTPTISPTPLPTIGELTINASPKKYSPTMSSTVGIGLTPDFSGQKPVNFSWETNYGKFLEWNQTTGKITEYNETAVANGTVYWSFLLDDTGINLPPVTIHVIAVNLTTGMSLANSTVYVGWEDNTTAVVIPAPCGVSNCHGTNVTCGQKIAEVCTMEYQLGDKCRSFAVCRVLNGTCTVVEQPGYRACVSCAENCNKTSGGDPVKAFECESKC